MNRLVLVASAGSLIIIAILTVLLHHGLTHPEEKDFFKRWFDTQDFSAAFEKLGTSHGGIALALMLVLIGVVI